MWLLLPYSVCFVCSFRYGTALMLNIEGSSYCTIIGYRYTVFHFCNKDDWLRVALTTELLVTVKSSVLELIVGGRVCGGMPMPCRQTALCPRLPALKTKNRIGVNSLSKFKYLGGGQCNVMVNHLQATSNTPSCFFINAALTIEIRGQSRHNFH